MTFTEQPFLPVILGADITAYSHVRAFHEEYNMRSLVLSQLEAKIISESKLCENRVIPGLENEDVLIENLIKVGKEFYGKKKLIILGCGDWYVRIIIENKKILSEYYLIPYIDEDLLNDIVLKDRFYGYCQELGIPYPKTYVYNCGEENDLKFDFDYPVIAKTANSAMYHYAKFPGKKKVFRFGNEKDLRNMLNNLEKSNYTYKFLVQDCIPGGDEFMRVLTCYSDQNGKVVFASLGHSLLEDHTPGAIGNPVAIVNEVNREIIDNAIKFLERVGYTGFSNFDIKYDTRDGKYKFFEINVRLGRSNFYVTGSGFNTVKWIVDDLVYNKKFEGLTIADKENLFTVVPKQIILRYVEDKNTQEQVKRLYKEKKVSYPLDYKPDMSPVRAFYVKAAILNQFRKYHRVEQAEKKGIQLEIKS